MVRSWSWSLTVPVFQNFLQQQFGSGYQQQAQQQQQEVSQHHYQQPQQFVAEQPAQQQRFQAQHIFSQPQNAHQQQQPVQHAVVSLPAVTRRSTRSSTRQEDAQNHQQQLMQQQQQLLLQQQHQLLQQQQEALGQQQQAAAATATAQQLAVSVAENKRERRGGSIRNQQAALAPAVVEPLPKADSRNLINAQSSSPQSQNLVSASSTAAVVAVATLNGTENNASGHDLKGFCHVGYKRCKLTDDPVALAQDKRRFPTRMIENILPPPRSRSQTGSTKKKRPSRTVGKKKDDVDSDSDYEAPASSSEGRNILQKDKAGMSFYRCGKSNVGLARNKRPYYQIIFEYFTQVPVPEGFTMEAISSRGTKRYRILMQCNACARKLFCNSTDASTLRIHVERYHYALFIEIQRKQFPDWVPPVGATDKIDKNLSPLEIMEEHFILDVLKSDADTNVQTLREACGVDDVDGVVHRTTCRLCSQSIFVVNTKITTMKEHLQRHHADTYIKWMYEGITLRFSAVEAEKIIARMLPDDIFWTSVDELPLTPFEQMEKNSVLIKAQPFPMAKFQCHACREILFFRQVDAGKLGQHFMRNHATEHALGITEEVKIRRLKTIFVAERDEREFFNSGWQRIFTLFYEGTMYDRDERSGDDVVKYNDVADLISKNPCYGSKRARLLDLCQCRICGLVMDTFGSKNADYDQEHIMKDHPTLYSYLVNWFGACDPRLIVKQLERSLCAQQFPLGDYADVSDTVKLGWLDVLSEHFALDDADVAAASQRQLARKSGDSSAAAQKSLALIPINTLSATVRCKICSANVPWLVNSLYYLAQHLKLEHFGEYKATTTTMLARQKEQQFGLSVAISTASAICRKQHESSHFRAKKLYDAPFSFAMADNFGAAWEYMESQLNLPADDPSYDPVDDSELHINLSEILCRFFDGLPRATTVAGSSQSSSVDEHAAPASVSQVLQLRLQAAMASNNKSSNLRLNTLTTVCTLCSRTIVCESLAYANAVLTRHLRFDHPTLCAELDIPPLDEGPNAGRIDADARAVMRFVQSEEKSVSAELSGSVAEVVEGAKEAAVERYTWFDVLLRYFHQLQSTVFSVTKKNPQAATTGGKTSKSAIMVPVFDADYANQYLKLECKLCDEKLFFTTCDRQNDIELLQRHFIDNHIKLFDKLVAIRRRHTRALVIKQVLMRRKLKYNAIRSEESKMLIEGGVNDALRRYLEGKMDSWASILWMFFKKETGEVRFISIKLDSELSKLVRPPATTGAVRASTEREICDIAYDADVDDDVPGDAAEPLKANVEPAAQVLCQMCSFSFKFHRHSARADEKNMLNLRKHLWRNHNPLYIHLQRIVPFEMPLINSEYWRRRKQRGEEELHLEMRSSNSILIRRKKSKLLATTCRSSTTLGQSAAFFSDSESDSSEDERRKAPFLASASLPAGERKALSRSAALIRLFLYERAKWKHVISNLFTVDSKCKVNASGPASSSAIVPKNERFTCTRLSNSKFLACTFCSRHVSVVNTSEAIEAKNHLNEFHSVFYSDLVRLKVHLEKDVLAEKENLKKLQESSDPASVAAADALQGEELAKLPFIANMCDLRLTPLEKNLLRSDSIQAHIESQVQPDVVRRGDVAETIREFYTFEPPLTAQEAVPPPLTPAEQRLLSTDSTKIKRKSHAEKGKGMAAAALGSVENGTLASDSETVSSLTTAGVDATAPRQSQMPLDASEAATEMQSPSALQNAADVPSSSGMEQQRLPEVEAVSVSIVEANAEFAVPDSDTEQSVAQPTSNVIVVPVHHTATCRVCEAVIDHCDSQTLVDHLQHNHWSLVYEVVRIIEEKVKGNTLRERLHEQRKAQEAYDRHLEVRKARAKMMEEIEKRRRHAQQASAELAAAARRSQAKLQPKVSFNVTPHHPQQQISATVVRKSFGGPFGMFGTKNPQTLSLPSADGIRSGLLPNDFGSRSKNTHKDNPYLNPEMFQQKKKACMPIKLEVEEIQNIDAVDRRATAKKKRRSVSPPVEWDITTRKKKIDFGRAEREWDSLLDEAERSYNGDAVVEAKKRNSKNKIFISGGEAIESQAPATAANGGGDSIDLVSGIIQAGNGEGVAFNAENASSVEEGVGQSSDTDKFAEPSSSELARALNILDDDLDDDPDFGVDADGGRNSDDDSDYSEGGRNARNRKLNNSSFNAVGGGSSCQLQALSKTAASSTFKTQCRLLNDPKREPSKRKIPIAEDTMPLHGHLPQPSKMSLFFGARKTPMQSAEQSAAIRDQRNQRTVAPAMSKLISFGLPSQKRPPLLKAATQAEEKKSRLTFGLSGGERSQRNQLRGLQSSQNAVQKSSSDFANVQLFSSGSPVQPQRTSLSKGTHRIKFYPDANDQHRRTLVNKNDSVHRIRFYPEANDDVHRHSKQKSSCTMSDEDDFERPATISSAAASPCDAPNSLEQNSKPKWPIFDDDALDNRGGEGDDDILDGSSNTTVDDDVVEDVVDDDQAKKQFTAEHALSENDDDNDTINEKHTVLHVQVTNRPAPRRRGRGRGSKNLSPVKTKKKSYTAVDEVSTCRLRERPPLRKPDMLNPEVGRPGKIYGQEPTTAGLTGNDAEDVDDKDFVRQEINERLDALLMSPPLPLPKTKTARKPLKRSVVLVSYKCLPNDDQKNRPADNVATLTLPNKNEDAFQTEGLLELRSVLDEEAMPLDKTGRRYTVPVDGCSAMERLFVLGFELKTQTLGKGFMLCHLVAEEYESHQRDNVAVVVEAKQEDDL